jgi:hypothetical protein
MPSATECCLGEDPIEQMESIVQTFEDEILQNRPPGSGHGGRIGSRGGTDGAGAGRRPEEILTEA